jgi:hypothetical protein
LQSDPSGRRLSDERRVYRAVFPCCRPAHLMNLSRQPFTRTTDPMDVATAAVGSTVDQGQALSLWRRNVDFDPGSYGLAQAGPLNALKLA